MIPDKEYITVLGGKLEKLRAELADLKAFCEWQKGELEKSLSGQVYLAKQHEAERDALRAELAATRDEKGTQHLWERIREVATERDALREQLATTRAAVIEECARAMNPMLRSMISRDEAARIIRSLAKGDRDE